jgi:hypothetical protein
VTGPRQLTLTVQRRKVLRAMDERYERDLTPLKMAGRTSLKTGLVNSTIAGELVGTGLARFSTRGRYLLITPEGREALTE